jgi:predicted ATPase
MSLKFIVIPSGQKAPEPKPNTAYLHEDTWDDWFKYSTLYNLVIIDGKGRKHYAGGVKIGEVRMKQDQRRPDLPESFTKLNQRFFSLGQDVDYYSTLRSLGKDIRTGVLIALRDIAYDSKVRAIAESEDVTSSSLMRSISPQRIDTQFSRVAKGKVKLTKYRFSYCLPQDAKAVERLSIGFDVRPATIPPRNIHVLIGRNGVGKTRIIDHMARSLTLADGKSYGDFEFESDTETSEFNNVVLVSFSAFDETNLAELEESKRVPFKYVGLRMKSSANSLTTRSHARLGNDLIDSIVECARRSRLPRLNRMLGMLEIDPLFEDINVTAWTEPDNSDLDRWKKRFRQFFKKLSSGHAIVLLTITRLVETVEESTLVLLDEPESHLHPPLLSAFVRTLSELMSDRNGVAIIATHSPVILQEVPQSCAWILSRSGSQAKAERPRIETFGENLGSLTREVFKYEHNKAGYHELIEEASKRYDNYEDALDYFGGHLGMEARGILRALIEEKKRGIDD